jgi:hypothetical protein
VTVEDLREQRRIALGATMIAASVRSVPVLLLSICKLLPAAVRRVPSLTPT